MYPDTVFTLVFTDLKVPKKLIYVGQNKMIHQFNDAINRKTFVVSLLQKGNTFLVDLNTKINAWIILRSFIREIYLYADGKKRRRKIT